MSSLLIRALTINRFARVTIMEEASINERAQRRLET
jgi:hypothetical protein